MTELSFDFFEDPEEPIIAAALKNGREWGYWADQQLRDPGGERGGWFIEMGGLNLFNGKGKDGKVRGIKGKYVGPSPMGQGFGRFLVQGQDGADDGIYHVNVANIDSVKGVLSDEYLRSLGRDVPVQKEGVIDLSQTRIDPITQQDLDDANIEPDKPKNLRKIAEGRSKSAKKLGDLKEGDLLFDEGNDRFGEVVATTDKDGNFSPWVKWENNQISQIPDAKPENETAVWASKSQGEAPVEEMAAPKKTVKGRDLKVGDVIRAYGKNRVIESIERMGSGEKYFTFETTGDEEDADGKLININDDVELGYEEAPAAPAAKPVKPVAEPAAVKKTAADLKKGDSVVINGETYSVLGKKTTKDAGEIVGYKVSFKSEDGAEFEADYAPGDTFETPSAQPAPATETKAKPQSNVVTGFADEFKPGDVLIANNGEEVLFISSELLPMDNKDPKKRYKVSLQRASGEIVVMELTGAIPRLVKRDAEGKVIEKVNRKADLKAAPAAPKPVKPVTEKPAVTTETPVVEQTFEAPTSANVGDSGQLSKNLGFEILPDGKIAIHGAGSFVLKDKIKELVGEISRSGVGTAKTFFSSPDKNPQDGLSKKAWIVEITPQSAGLDEISLGFLKKLHGESNKKKSEVKSESGEISGSKATTGTLANGVNYSIDDSGKITISGSVNENSGGIQDALFAEDMPEMVMDQDEETGNITLSSLTDEDSERAKILNTIKSSLEGGKTEEPATAEPEVESKDTDSTTKESLDFGNLIKLKADPESARKAGFTVDSVKPVDIQVGDYISNFPGYWVKVVGKPSVSSDPRFPDLISWQIPTENYKGKPFTETGTGDLNLRIDRVRGANHVDTPETPDTDSSSIPFPMDSLSDLGEGMYVKVDGVWKKITKIGKPKIDPSTDSNSALVEFEDGTKRNVDDRDNLTVVRKLPEGEPEADPELEDAEDKSPDAPTDEQIAEIADLMAIPNLLSDQDRIALKFLMNNPNRDTFDKAIDYLKKKLEARGEQPAAQGEQETEDTPDPKMVQENVELIRDLAEYLGFDEQRLAEAIEKAENASGTLAQKQNDWAKAKKAERDAKAAESGTVSKTETENHSVRTLKPGDVIKSTVGLLTKDIVGKTVAKVEIREVSETKSGLVKYIADIYFTDGTSVLNENRVEDDFDSVEVERTTTYQRSPKPEYAPGGDNREYFDWVAKEYNLGVLSPEDLAEALPRIIEDQIKELFFGESGSLEDFVLKAMNDVFQGDKQKNKARIVNNPDRALKGVLSRAVNTNIFDAISQNPLYREIEKSELLKAEESRINALATDIFNKNFDSVLNKLKGVVSEAESTTVEEPANPPSQKQLDSITRRLEEDGVVTPERAQEIRDLLPTLDKDTVGDIIKELDRAQLKKRMANGESIEDLRVPADMAQEVQQYLDQKGEDAGTNKPEFFDPAANFMTAEQNNNAYWDWVKESIKNGTISPEDMAEAVERLRAAVLSSKIAAEALDPSGNSVRGNILKSNVLYLLNKNPDATFETVLNGEDGLSSSAANNLSLDKDFNAWRKLLGDETFYKLRDSLQAQLDGLAEEYYNEAKQGQTEEPVAEQEPEVKPAAEELLKNAVEKKASEINVGDRVFDKESQSFATVVGVSQDPDLPARVRITVRFEDGREGSALYKKSYVLLTYQEPKSEEPEKTEEPVAPDATPVEQDSQDAVEQGDSVPAEPGSVVVEEPAAEPEAEEVKPEPKKPRTPRGPRKPKKLNLDGVSEKEKKYFTDLFRAYERVRRIEEKFGAPTYVPKYTIGDEQPPIVEEASTPLRLGSSIGEPLGIAIQPSTTDAVNPDNGYSVRQPTPGAFTGTVADLVEGKTKSETRDIINGLKVQWFDTETTGISSFDGDPTNNDVVQVGIVTTENGEVLQRLNIYINPGIEDGIRLGKWSAENLVRDVVDEDGNPVLGEDGKPKVEKVTDEWLSEQMSITEAVKQIIKFMGPNPIIGGQNVPFDLEVLQRMLDKSGIKGIGGFKIAGTIDSKDLAESFLPKYNEAEGIDGPKKFDKVQDKYVPTSSLGFVAEFLGFGLTRWHSADGDAEDAWKLTSSILGLAAEKDPNGTDDLMNKAAMAARYNKRMREFLNTIDPSNPSTAKQHGAVTKDGFGEYLDDLGMNKTLQNQIFSVIKNMTRGEAAEFIKVFVQANPISKKQVSRRPIDLNDVIKGIQSLEQKKNVPLPANLEELPSVGEDTDKATARYTNNLIKFLRAGHPDLDPMAILSERQHEKLLSEELPFFEEWYSQTVKQPVFRRIKVGNAVFKFEEGTVPEGSLAIITNALDYLQKKYSVGGMRLNVSMDTTEELNKLGGQEETAGVAWVDSAGGHIVLSKAILGQIETDRRPGRKGHVSMELATLIHEYGHIYHEAVMGTNFTEFEDMDLAADFLKKFKKTTITPYGETSNAEKFAELFYDMVYSEMDGVEPAVPAFADFMKSIAGKRATYKPLSLIDTIKKGANFTLSGTKRTNRKELSPENTTPEFAGATLLTGDALAEFEKRQSLAATDDEAGYIPDVNDEAAYRDFKRRLENPNMVMDDRFYRELFKQTIEDAKKDARRYKVLKVDGTNSFIRWKSGDASPEAIQTAVDQMRELESFNDIGGAPKYVTLAKRGKFTMTRVFEANDPLTNVYGFSFSNPSGVYIVANPDSISEETNVKGEWFRRGGADAPNMFSRTLVHEYAHGWARVILGSYFRQISQNKYEHNERFLEFMNLFPDVRGITPSHPISDMAHETFGESFAEFFNAAYWQINKSMSLPGKDTPLFKFIKFFGKYSSADPVMFVARSKAFGSFDIPGAVEELSIPSTIRFPSISRVNSPTNLLREFDARREFYRNGLTPSGTPTSAKHAGLVKRYFEMLEADERRYYADDTKENYDRLVAGVSALKKFYDSLFFSYAKNNPKTDVKKIADRISTLEKTFRSWTSSTPILNIAGKGNFHNQFVAGSYETPSGMKYPIAYLNTFLTGETESAVAIALDPRYQGIDMSDMTMSNLMDYAIGVLIAGSKPDMPVLTLNGALVSNGHRRRGIATALLNFLRQNNKGKILHPETKDAEISAWAQSVDVDLENYIKTPGVFEDNYGTANQDRHAINVRTQAADTEQKKISDDALDAEALHYAGQTYGELFHPNLQDYTSEEGGGLGSYKSTVGFVSARLLSSIRGNNPSDEDSVARKVESLRNNDGFAQPVSVVYNPRTGEAYVADGNHRVQASLEAGVSHVPTRVFIVDEPPARKTATPRKVERSGGLPLPDGALEVHPYFVFDRNDLINSDNQNSPEIVEEMLTNLALWSSRVQGTPGVQRNYLPDPNNIYEQLAPGEFVADKSTGKIYKVYGIDFEELVNADGQRVFRKTGKIVVRSLDGILDQMDVIRDSTEFNAAGIRYTRVGMSNVDRNYNDIRVYTDELRDPRDFENVTDSFMKLSDQPILINDTMFVIQRETGLKGRISGFVSEGIVRVDVLKGYDEDDDPIYEQVEMPVSEILPIQNQREVGPDEEPKNHSDEMKITLAQKDSINSLSSKLLKWGFISEEYYKAVQLSLNAGFITKSGASELYRDLYNRDVLRVSKIRGTDVKADSLATPEQPREQGEVSKPSTPVASEEQEVEAKSAPGKRSFEDLLKLKLERAKRDRVVKVEEFSLPVTNSKVTKDQPTPSQILEVERRLSEPGVVSEERASQILEALPLLNAAALDGILEELRTATLNKRIANDQDASDVNIPEDYNTSKLDGYVPRRTMDNQPIVEESSVPEEVIQESEDEDGGEGIELSGEQKAVADHVLHAKEGVIFLTGKAGAGKSTLVREIQRLSKKRGKGVVIAAPTGVAALNAKGKTLHATFGFPIGLLAQIDMADHVAKMAKSPTGRGKLGVLKAMDLMIVDEISMVSADMVDAMDRMLRLARGEMSKPFGGAKILMVGDPAQLPPVSFDDPVAADYMRENYLSDWFFDANVWAANPFEKFTLTEVFRQSDPEFIDALNAIRDGSVTQADVDYFNDLARKNADTEQTKNAPRLVPTNSQAEEINSRELEALEGTPVTFTGEFKGPGAEGFFEKIGGPLPAKDSVFKVGEPVMFVKNDDSDQRAKAGAQSKDQRWVNGTVGVIVGFKRTEDGKKAIIVEVDGKKLTVATATWEKIGYSLNRRATDEKTQSEVITTEVEATYEQVPLKPAWAITIHKSQGQTYDAAVVDYTRKQVEGGRERGGAFAPGQTYVALSRLRSPEGLKLEVPLKISDFKVDRRVQQFLSGKPDTQIAVSESAITKDFDPLKGFETSAELESAIMNNKITGPNGETLTVYQRNALMTYLKKIQENPGSADRIRSKMSALLESWFGVNNPEEMSTRKRPVDIDMSSFRDPAEKQALLDLLSANGIPYNLKYDSEK